MKLLEEHIVPEGVSNVRLSDYLAGVFQAIPSRKGIKKAIKRGAVQVDGATGTTGLWVQPGQRIQLYDLEPTPPQAYPLYVQIPYKDEHLAIVQKPAGLPVSGNHYRTLVNALIDQLPLSNLPDALPWAMPVHRLDAPTSGLLVLARSRSAQVALGQAFEQREVEKTYQAICCGRADEQGAIEQPLEGQPARTTFVKMEECRSLRCGWLSRMQLHPHTGRTHQLRRHLSGQGWPILGDKLYTPPDAPLLKGKGLFLCATALRLIHPIDQSTLHVAVNPPKKFDRMMDRAGERWAAVNL